MCRWHSLKICPCSQLFILAVSYSFYHQLTAASQLTASTAAYPMFGCRAFSVTIYELLNNAVVLALY